MTGVSFGYGTGSVMTAAQWAALFAQCYPAGNVSTYSATLLAGSTQAAWFTALGLPSAAPGFANGLATLNSSGQLTTSQIPASVLGALNYQGIWNASSNSPVLVSGVGTKGFYYKISTIGTTTIDGCSSWALGDFIVFNGVTWDKIDGQVTQIPSAQISDSTSYGRALLTGASVLAQRAALNIDQATTVADANQTMTNAMESVAWTSITAPRTGTLPAASTMNVGQTIFIFDESGNCSAANTITISRAGADTINGGTSFVLNSAYAGVTLTRVSSSKWTAGPGSAANALGFRNRLINAPFSVNQRVVSGTVTLAAGAFGHDHVKAGASGCTYTFATSGLDTTITITAGTLIMPVESTMIEGGIYSLSHAGTAQARVWQGTGSTGSGSYAATPFQTTSLAAATQTNAEFSTGTVLRPQLEPGSSVTAFERRPYGVELALAQRYFAKTFPQVAAPANNTGSYAGALALNTVAIAGFWIAQFTFPMNMRVSPTITTYNWSSGTAGYWEDSSSSNSLQALVYGVSDRSALVALNNGSSYTPGSSDNFYIHLTANAEL